MIRGIQVWNALWVSTALWMGASAWASDDDKLFEVTVTNITQGEIFTPILVASHRRDVRLFSLGEAASPQLAMLAEGGDTGPLGDWLQDHGALDVVSTGAVLPPGESVTVQVKRDSRHNHVSVAAMLVPSNDAFFAVNGMKGPRKSKSSVHLVPAYDAGSELNDELCVSIPGPPFICAGEGYSVGDGEGYVHIHPGIQGVGDLIAAQHDWRNPVAKITIHAIKD